MSEGRPQDSAPGYRGALPPRNDWLARAWVIVVIVIFVLMFVLSALGIPTVLLPEPTPSPAPSVAPASSGSPAESASPDSSEGLVSGSPAPSATDGGSGSPEPTP